MKKNRLLLYLTFIVFGLLLTACTGGTGNPQSWPGVTPDEPRNTVYVANNQHVYAVDLQRGTEKWRFPQEADKVTFFAAPVLTENDQLVIGGYDNILYSLDPQSGAQRWTFETAENKYIGAAATVDERIIAPNSDNLVYTVNDTGVLKWQYETEHDLWGTPVIGDDIVYVPSMDHHVYAFHVESGNLIWVSKELSGAVAGNPALSVEGVLYVGTFGNELIALDTTDGSILWRFEASNWVWNGPALEDDTLYFGDLSGTLYALDAENGAPIWQVQPDTSEQPAISDSPLIVEDTLYFVNEGGSLYAIARDTGTTRAFQSVEARLYTSPVVADGTILISTVNSDAILYAFDLDLVPKWQFAPED